MDDEELRKSARARLKARSDFKHYLWVWLGVSLIVVVIWLITGYRTYFWPAWPIAGMGIGAFFMALSAYGPGTRVITDADVDAEVEKLRQRKGL